MPLGSGEYIGKITSAEYGLGGGGADDQLGLKVSLIFEGRAAEMFHATELEIKGFLVYANVQNVSQLKGKPIAVKAGRGVVDSWRILTEVL